MASSRLSRGHMSLSRYICARIARTSGSSASISNGITIGIVAGIESETASVRFWNPGRALTGDTRWSSCMRNRSVGDRCRPRPTGRTGGQELVFPDRPPLPSVAVVVVVAVMAVPESSEMESGQSSWKASTTGVASPSPDAAPVSSTNFTAEPCQNCGKIHHTS